MTPRSASGLDRLGLGDALGGQPDHVERADQVDLDDSSEVVERERAVLAQRLDRVADAGAVDDDPHRAQRFGGVERRDDRSLISDVGLGEGRPLAEFGDRLLAPDVQNNHLRTGVQQALGGGQAKPGGATGDDGYGVLDLHWLSSSLYTQSRRTASVSTPGFPGGLGCGVTLRENRGAGIGCR